MSAYLNGLYTTFHFSIISRWGEMMIFWKRVRERRWQCGTPRWDQDLNLCTCWRSQVCGQKHWNTRSSMLSFIKITTSRDSAVGIATGYGLDDWEVEVRVLVGSRILTSPCRPDQLWGPPNLLYNGYWGLFPGGNAAGAWSWPLTSN
jgi:hypothetical protein